MADDHFSRPPRPSNPLARQSGQRASRAGGDPLAELARLIGQSDPYAAYAPTPPQGEHDDAHAANSHYPQDEPVGWRTPGAARPQPGYQDGSGPDESFSLRPPFRSMSYPQSRASDYGDPAYGDQAYDDRGYGDQRYADHGGGNPAYPDQTYQDQTYREPYYGSGETYPNPNDAAYPDRNYDPQSYDPQSYDPQSYNPQYAEPTHDARYGDPQQAAPQQGVPQFASPAYDDKPYPAYDNQYHAGQPPGFPPAPGDPYAAQYGQDASGGYYNDPNSPAYGGVPVFQHEAPHADEAPARRRNGLVTVLAVLALAVVGTAAAFGYRAVFTTSGTRVPPPVIKADSAPSKIVPAASDSSKPIQDRVGDRAQLERIITREEQPVDVNTARAGAPRVVFPGANPIAPLPNSPIPPSPAASAMGAAAPTGSAAASTEPKRIRTVTIRSDHPEMAAVADAASSAVPAASGSLSEDDPAQSRNAARNYANAPAANSSSPMSLSPGGSSAQRTTAPMRTASAPAATAGGYSVQVTSQRSQGEAQSAYAQLQAKYPSVLGNRQAVIRRADLGEKGIYYRAQIPFGSQGEAADFCGSLRSAGGQCVVQRN